VNDRFKKPNSQTSKEVRERRWRKDAKKWLSKKISGIKGDDLMMSKCIGVNRMCSG
jgi:hypothetical protein